MKMRRNFKIRELISTNEIETQEELVAALHEAGFKATQATVSRDIREMQLIKVPLMSGRSKYSMPEVSSANPLRKLRRSLQDHFINIDNADNLIVMKCHPGTANAVGALIDQLKWNEIVGTICGDDTILIICRTKSQSEELINRLLGMIE